MTTFAAFPHPTLTPITGKPTPISFRRLHSEVLANAVSVPSLRGGGELGHATLVLTAAEYLADAGVAFEVPAHPGVTVVHANNATTAQINANDRSYDTALADYKTYTATDHKLKAGILEAVEEDYLVILKDPRYGYARVTTRTLLGHLQTTYGQIKPADLEENREKITAAWNPDDDIDTIWARNRLCQEFASASPDPISDSALMVLTLKALAASGVMTTYISEWERKDDDQTYTAFKQHFNRANKARLREITATQAGFHKANAVQKENEPPAVPPTKVDGIVEAYYCWTHGLGFNKAHTSKACKFPKPGHQHDATILDMMGGNNVIWNRRKNSDRGNRTQN